MSGDPFQTGDYRISKYWSGGKVMYTRILVPLDGSKLAECVLPHLETIAAGCGTQQIILVSVTEKLKVNQPVMQSHGEQTVYQVLERSTSGIMSVPMKNSVIGDYQTDDRSWTKVAGKMYTQADKYLDRIQRKLIKKGLNVETEVLIGDPAAAIIAYARENNIDLIIIASHGRSGISRWASGSVAERIFRGCCVPVLMIRAPGCIPGIQ